MQSAARQSRRRHLLLWRAEMSLITSHILSGYKPIHSMTLASVEHAGISQAVNMVIIGVHVVSVSAL